MLIDACGGSRAFADSVRGSLLAKLGTPDALGPEHPLFNISSDGMTDLTKPRLRLFAMENYGKAPLRFNTIHLGKGDLIVTDLDKRPAGHEHVGHRRVSARICARVHQELDSVDHEACGAH
jgi:hypothetical protein